MTSIPGQKGNGVSGGFVEKMNKAREPKNDLIFKELHKLGVRVTSHSNLLLRFNPLSRKTIRTEKDKVFLWRNP